MRILIIYTTLLVFLMSCSDEEFTTKPRGFYQIDLPEHSYNQFNEPGFPYQFQYPKYGNLVKDTLFFDKKPENPYWMNIDFDQWGGKIYLTYKQIKNNDHFYSMLRDIYKITEQHEKKADYIRDPKISIPDKKVYGYLFDVGGNAASALQFYVTDSTDHLLRGALYFDVTPNADSLKPINEFLRQDVVYLINSLSWTK